MQGFLNPPTYGVDTQISKDNYQCFPANWKQIALISRSSKPPGAHIQTLSYIKWFFQWRADYVAPARFQCTAIAFIALS